MFALPDFFVAKVAINPYIIRLFYFLTRWESNVLLILTTKLEK